MSTSNSTNAERTEKTPGGIATDIMEFAGRMGAGKPFSTCEMPHLGKRAALDQALSRLVRAGRLTRVKRGMYVLPKASPVFGPLPPSAKDVLAAVSRVTGEAFEASPETALSALRLTTQNQLARTFSTTGRPRTLQMSGMQPIRLKSAPWKKAVAPLMGSMAGVAAIGLLSLGPKNVDKDVLDTIKKNMSAEDFDRLLSAAPRMPSWLADILLHEKTPNSSR
jgi:hypothetical protein